MKINQEESNKYQKHYKWIIMTQFFFSQYKMEYLRFMDSFRTAMLIPIWPLLALYYKVQENEINWLMNWIYILPFLLGFFLNKIILKNYGLSQSLCCFFEAFGMWIAYQAKNDFQMAVVGYAITGIGTSFVMQTPLCRLCFIQQDLSKLWFNQEQRIVSTFLGQYAMQIGGLSGFVFSNLQFQGIEEWNQIVYRINQLFLITSILITISFAFSFVAFIKPNRENQQFLARESQMNSIRKIFSQAEFSLDIISFSFIISFPWIYPSLLINQQILMNKEYMEMFQNSFIQSFVGILFASYFTFQLYKQSRNGLQQNYDLYLKRFITIGYLAFIIEMLFLEVLSNYIMIFLNILIGSGITSIQSVILESLMEKHYPCSEIALGQILVACPSLIAFVLSQLLTTEALFQFGLQLFGYFLIFPFCFILAFYKTKFIRFEAEG